MMMVQYLLDADAQVTIPGVAAPETEFADVVAPVALALEQERRVTDQIAALVGVARDESDYLERAVRAVVPQGAGRGGRDDVLAARRRRALADTPMVVEDYLAREHTRRRGGGPDRPAGGRAARSSRRDRRSDVLVAAADRDALGVEVLEQRLGELARGAELVAQLRERDRAAVAAWRSRPRARGRRASASGW